MDFGKEEAAKLFEEMFESKVQPAINNAVKDHTSRALKKHGDAILERIEEVVPELIQSAGGDKPTGKDKGKEPTDPETSKRIADLERKNEELETERAKNRRREALDKALATVNVQGLSDFTKKGILDSIEESDGAFFVGDKRLDDWAKSFAASDEGKHFIPAKGGGGTGIKPGVEAPAGSGPDGEIDIADALRKDLASGVSNF